MLIHNAVSAVGLTGSECIPLLLVWMWGQLQGRRVIQLYCTTVANIMDKDQCMILYSQVR